MPLPAYKPPRESRIGRILGHKVCSFIAGILHLVLSITALIHMASGKNPVKGAGVTIVTVLEGLANVIFCIILLLGLLKNNKCFVKTYLIYNVVFVILVIIGFFIILFTPSMSLGVSGFFSFLIGLLLYLLFLFVVHTYYIMTYCKPNATPNVV